MSDPVLLPEATRARLRALRRLGLGPNENDASLDRHTRIAGRALRAPVVLLSLVEDERQYFPSQIGLGDPWAELGATPLSHSFCKHVVASGERFVVTDSATDDRVSGNDAIDALGVASYAGEPVRDPNGQVLGSFCVIDHEAREWNKEELSLLRDLADAVESEFALRAASGALQERERLDLLELHFEASFGTVATAANRAETVVAATRALVEHGSATVGASLITIALVEDDVLRFSHGPGVDESIASEWVTAPLDAEIPMAQAVRTGEAVHLEDISSFAGFPEFEAPALKLGIESFRAEPFVEPKSGLRGVIGLGWTDPVQQDETPVAVHRLVRLAVQSLQRSTHFEQERDHARVLEEIVLPTGLPPSEHYQIEGRYRAPSSGQRVGGDVYDGVVRDDGLIGVMIADAVGHDIRAARVAARLRHAVGVLTITGANPSDVLAIANRYVLASTQSKLISCAYLLFDPFKETVTVSCAGHPQPLMKEDHAVTPLGALGEPILGLGPFEYTERTYTLPRGASVVAFTDGLIEPRHSTIIDGENKLRSLLAEATASSASKLANTLMDGMTGRDPDDDVAVLVVRCHRVEDRPDQYMPLDPFSAVYLAGGIDLAAIRGQIRAWLGPVGDSAGAETLLLVATELLTNARASSQAQAEIGFSLRESESVDFGAMDRRIRVQVTNPAAEFSINFVMPGPGSLRGRGLPLVEALAQHSSVETVDDITSVTADVIVPF